MASFLLCLSCIVLCLSAVYSIGPYNVDLNQTSVSGISAGAFFAVQLQVAYSKTIRGCGVVAGGPFYCAQASMITALTNCMNVPASINVDTLVSSTKNFASQGSIDPIENLKSQNMYLFSGTKDTVVNPGVMKKLVDYYKALGIPSSNIVTNFDTPAEHAMITDNFGNDCNYLGSPFINNCQISGAGVIFKTIYGANAMQPPVDYKQENLVQFSQPSASGLAKKAYAYIPTACQQGQKCTIHVAVHGCKQGYEIIGTDFVLHAGYNQWAESNNIIILYPQSTASYFSPSNPNGCMDWFGYTGNNYFGKSGVQMKAVKQMMEQLSGQSFD